MAGISTLVNALPFHSHFFAGDGGAINNQYGLWLLRNPVCHLLMVSYHISDIQAMDFGTENVHSVQ
ncbi:MAG: hypothetical protein N3B18_01655 [Desulfobacterota bacterium]|nr:hypothetical protein [Thermodesulfobacteriota bacterium]